MKGTLDYATPPQSRLSRFAVFSLVLAIASCPCLALPLIHNLSRPVALILPFASELVGITALVRIRESKGLRRGYGVAAFAIGLSLLWIAAVLFLALNPDPHPE